MSALAETTPDLEVKYRGPRPDLIARSSLPVTVHRAPGGHIFETSGTKPTIFHAIPEVPPTWLDILDDEKVEAHAALPMRYYLAAEQQLGVRLSANEAPCPQFQSAERRQPFHVAFVNATSWPARKDFGPAGFESIVRYFERRRSAPWRFSVITGEDAPPQTHPALSLVAGVDAADCVDVFASADVVIGNDTGLTHLAALTTDRVGNRPHVVGLYGRHSHTKWTTGFPHHHAVATPFAQMLSAADRCPVRDDLDDHLWADAADITALAGDQIAEFVGRHMRWW